MEEHLASIGRPAGLPRAMLVGFLDAVPASAAILDGAGDVIAVNSAWRRFATCNGGDPEAWIGSNYLTITDQSDDVDALAVAAGLRSVLAGDRDSFDHEYPCHSPCEQRWFRCLTTRLCDSDAITTLGAAVMHLDVSAQKRAELSAQNANRAKSEFLASLSHELRTPLNAILGFSEMMTLQVWGALGDNHYHAYAGDIHRAGSHLLSLINEVLDLSKVEAGRFELHEQEMDVAEVVRQAHTLVADRANRAGVELVQAMPPLPPLRADARLVAQVLLNLLSNAVKFTPEGGSVATSARLDERGGLEVSVRDTGIGIAAHDVARALEPFGQVDSEQGRRHSAESTGLGLPLSRRFMELHGGRLRLDSTPGTGTVVTISFPPERVLAS